jgi:hypothetical protein
MRALTTAVIAFGFGLMLAQTALAEETEALSAATSAQKRANEEADRGYKAATRGDNAATVKVDPWATVRPSASEKKPEKKAAAKKAEKKTRQPQP